MRQNDPDKRKRSGEGDVVIILGSGSPWRLKVLKDAGVSCIAMDANIDEKAIRHPDPKAMTLHIATAKAAALLPRIAREVRTGRPTLLITADQVAVVRGEVREKPRDEEEARRWLLDYAHRMVSTITAVVVTDVAARRARHAVHEATVVFRDMPHAAVDAAVARGTVLGSCGAFTIDDPDLAPFVRLPTGRRADPDNRSSIEGLPLGRTLALLESFGWRRPER